MEPGARVSLQYDRLYVENEVYLYNDIEQKVERMLMGRGGQQDNLATPRGGGGGRASRLRGTAGSRAGGELEPSHGRALAHTQHSTETGETGRKRDGNRTDCEQGTTLSCRRRIS